MDVIVQIANAKIALGRKRTRHGGKTTPSVGHHAWLLCTVARYWVKDVQLASELQEVARRLNVKQKGMTERNRFRLRQFDLKANVDALLHLPDVVFERAQRNKTAGPDVARQAMLAFAVELLIIAPMRVANLTGLDKDRHILEFGRKRQRSRHILIPGEETKTGELFEVILPSRTVAMMDTYISTYRKLVCPETSPYLFPSSSGEARSEVAFSKAISQFVERETGIKMHVHLFRHLAGKLHLDANPDDIETVRRVLGHTNSSTTARYYAEHRTSQAFRRLDATISELRAPPGRLMAQHSYQSKARAAR